ncbi:TPA: hypothetical protein ACWLUJ_005719 [Pseudomonas aeruginosa]|nr:hypothetical protein [Pseudomonas aeruginosa]EIU2863562.1 hypothetical protein [Pseudomonas aeruginosa]HEJ2342749.1 hypothetical protein [Pseudomonas aeruginosa]HEK3716886.1 hypothetical protein [Pseudomonas aeruginosa]
MPHYYICQDGGRHNDDDYQSLNYAIDLAEQHLAANNDDQTTFTVENQDGYMLACATNRRIIGTFSKQQWDGNDEANTVEEVEFDATDYVLLLTGEAIRALVDGRDSSDQVGLAHISWDGPFRVDVVDSITRFFGVASLQEITDESLAYAKGRVNPQPAVEQVLTLSIKVRLRVAPGASVSEFIDNLDYSVTSNTAGIAVQETEIVDAE